MRRVNGDLGYRLVEEAGPVAEGVLQVRPTAAWLRSGGRDAHLMGALAFYELWKNYQDGRRVTLVMTDDRGEEYIRIADGDPGRSWRSWPRSAYRSVSGPASDPHAEAIRQARVTEKPRPAPADWS